MIFDTNVLIKLERETRRKIDGPASSFLRELPATRMCITPTIAGEFACGMSMSKRSVWEAVCVAYEMLPITADTAWHYGELVRTLALKGNLIGTNDMWIAATALAHNLPLATGNIKEFERVPGLVVVAV